MFRLSASLRTCTPTLFKTHSLWLPISHIVVKPSVVFLLRLLFHTLRVSRSVGGPSHCSSSSWLADERVRGPRGDGRNVRWGVGERARRGAGEGGRSTGTTSRGDRKDKDDGSTTEGDAVDVVLLTGVIAPTNVGSVTPGLMVSVACRGRVSTSSCNAFCCCCCSGLRASLRLVRISTTFGFDLSPSSILPSVDSAKYCATKSSDAIGLLDPLPPSEYDEQRRRIGW